MPFPRKRRVSLGVQQWCFCAPDCGPTVSNPHQQSPSSLIPTATIDRRATAAVAAWRAGWAQSSVWAAAYGPLAIEHTVQDDRAHVALGHETRHRAVTPDPQLDRLATWAGAAAAIGAAYLVIRIAISLITHQ